MAGENLNWVFDGVPASGAVRGGFGSGQIFTPEISTFVRETLQNCRDQLLDGSEEAVRVTFRLVELQGAEVDEFLGVIGWSELGEHIECASKDMSMITLRPRLQAGLRSVGSKKLRVLLISDFNTNGLTGDEDDKTSNINALCRNELITSSSRNESGGSFGVGKSVFWRFSELSTVLFHSIEKEQSQQRFFGRTILGFHQVDGEEFEGSGWYGAKAERKNGFRAESVFGAQADEMAEAIGCARPDGETGTTVVVVGFDDPSQSPEPDVETLCRQMVDACNLWFWPALDLNHLEVTVVGQVAGSEVFREMADADDPRVNPFRLAGSLGGSTVESDHERISQVEISLDVPAQDPDAVDGPLGRAQATAGLHVRSSDEGDGDELESTVAMVRGTGMVIQYKRFSSRRLADFNFHAVLLAGSAHGESIPDHALERFLRAAEPPKHDQWIHNTERAKDVYRSPKKVLDALDSAVMDALKKLAEVPDDDTTEGPDRLKKRFELPGLGKKEPTKDWGELIQPSAVVDGGKWSFSGIYMPPTETPAGEDVEFKIVLALDQEGGGRGVELRLESLVVQGEEYRTSSVAGPSEVRVNGAPAEVAFSGVALPPDGFDQEKASRVCISMNASALEGI